MSRICARFSQGAVPMCGTGGTTRSHAQACTSCVLLNVLLSQCHTVGCLGARVCPLLCSMPGLQPPVVCGLSRACPIYHLLHAFECLQH